MKEKQLLLCMFVGGILLAGCSSKPDVGDVEGGIKKVWETCKVIKPTNFKKTNGVDHGDSYQMAISYEYEIVEDIATEDAMYPPDDFLRRFEAQHPGTLPTEEQNRANNDMLRAVGERVTEYRAKNCPAIEQFFIAISGLNRNLATAPLRKGEKIEVSAEYTMVKSEKGWIAQ